MLAQIDIGELSLKRRPSSAIWAPLGSGVSASHECEFCGRQTYPHNDKCASMTLISSVHCRTLTSVKRCDQRKRLRRRDGPIWGLLQKNGVPESHLPTLMVERSTCAASRSSWSETMSVESPLSHTSDQRFHNN